MYTPSYYDHLKGQKIGTTANGFVCLLTLPLLWTSNSICAVIRSSCYQPSVFDVSLVVLVLDFDSATSICLTSFRS